jgi:hypothetical protein
MLDMPKQLAQIEADTKAEIESLKRDLQKVTYVTVDMPLSELVALLAERGRAFKVTIELRA